MKAVAQKVAVSLVKKEVLFGHYSAKGGSKTMQNLFPRDMSGTAWNEDRMRFRSLAEERAWYGPCMSIAARIDFMASGLN